MCYHILYWLSIFRVGIPVIIMGETGCGKTMLVEFMSKLQIPYELRYELHPMEVLKVGYI